MTRDPEGYSHVWKREENLEHLNKRIHDGFPTDKLDERARNYVDLIFDVLYPFARPTKNSKIMEFGGGLAGLWNTC